MKSIDLRKWDVIGIVHKVWLNFLTKNESTVRVSGLFASVTISDDFLRICVRLHNCIAEELCASCIYFTLLVLKFTTLDLKSKATN